MEPHEVSTATGLHPIELCVYSVLSNNLDGLYQSVNELRESQALLLVKLRQIRTFLKDEQDFYDEQQGLTDEIRRLKAIKVRTEALVERYEALSKSCL
ncbi:LADA_0E09076g1_1 [Lachancea dasiensis]|uniref:LADA_0E09076g1_1 n=1 Tax=Lachancea dasiensis TaxID=1072105 RepID=A0A1G4JDJ6_9SACH|nr:LADA_0E09076g1_1 [Lachancea dasiensis]